MPQSKTHIKRRLKLRSRQTRVDRNRGSLYNLNKEGKKLLEIIKGERVSKEVSMNDARKELFDHNENVRRKYTERKLLYDKVKDTVRLQYNKRKI